jgi:hypothetical protein
VESGLAHPPPNSHIFLCQIPVLRCVIGGTISWCSIIRLQSGSYAVGQTTSPPNFPTRLSMCLHLPLFEPFETLSVCPRSPTFPHAAINRYAVAKSFQACLVARRLPAEATNSSLPQFQLHFPNPAHRAPIPLRVARLVDDGPELDNVEDRRERLDFSMLLFGVVFHWHQKHIYCFTHHL